MVISKLQQGFSMIELMVVVAIVGILATFGMNAYGGYVSKAYFSGALGEIAAGKLVFEYKQSDDPSWVPVNTMEITLPAVTQSCNVSVTATDIVCTFKSDSRFPGNYVLFRRTPETTTKPAFWTCVTDVDQRFSSSIC